MAETTEQTGVGERAVFEMMEIARLFESSLNPRRLYDADRIKELADSISSVGVIEPLVVRVDGQDKEIEHPPKYEIVTGSRRYRAAKVAGVEKIPVLIREMTDQQSLEIMVIENNQREDVNALEEAEGYRRLMKLGYGLDRLAERIGRSHKYIYDRIKLLQLVPSVKNLVLEGIVSSGHAILLARLTTSEQKRAVDENTGGLWQHEALLWDPKEHEDNVHMKTRSIRELQGWIDEHVRFDRDAEVNRDLFPVTAEIVKHSQEKKLKVIQITHNYVTKPDAKEGNTERIYSERSWKLADGSKGNKTCEKSVTGVIVVGLDRGAAYNVCIDKDCNVHRGKEKRERAKRKADGSQSKYALQEQRSHEKYKREQEERERKQKEWNAAQKTILTSCAEKIKISKPGVLAEAIYRGFRGHVLKDAQSLMTKKWENPEELLQLFAMAVFVEDFSVWNAWSTFPARAKRIGVDVVGILKAIKKSQSYSEPTCAKCGCTEQKACPGGCSWVELDKKTNVGICSSCSPVQTSAQTAKRQKNKKKKA